MIIERCFQDIVAKLKSHGKVLEMSHQLMLLDTNDRKVLFVYNIIENFNAFPKVQEVKKNDHLSVYYRNLGNICFQEFKHHRAWQYYNLSLLNAPLCSENYCLALSNRSAVFYQLKKYNECLKDIEEVLSLEFPKKILDKLLKRKDMCEEALKTAVPDVEIRPVLEIDCEKDSRYLGASTKLEVKYTDELGRHVVAKEDIKVGEVLAQEDPYFSLLLKSQIVCGCSYCFSRSLNLLPCDSCCLALYCSIECKEKALREYHSIECPLMVTLFEMDFTKLELLALRTVIKARQDHNNWNDLFKTIEAAEANYNSEFRGHVRIDDKWIYGSQYYAPIHTLSTNIKERPICDIFQKAVSAAVLLRFLELNTNFLNVDSNEDKEKIKGTVAGLLLLHLMTSPTNMHGISTNIETEIGNFTQETSLGSAPYAFFSLLNHSCSPNVVRYSKLGTARMTLFALRPIKKGTQIVDNYGAHHATDSRISRQDTLKIQYKFTCMCEACAQSWPTYYTLSTLKLSRVPPNLCCAKSIVLGPEPIESLKQGDIITANRIFERLCRLCEKLEPYAPSLELCDSQEALKQCLCIFEGLSLRGYTQLIDWKEMLPSEATSQNMNRFVKNTLKSMTLR